MSFAFLITNAKLWNRARCVFHFRMLITTHIIVTIFICLLLNLDQNEWFIAFMFGVFIDADHLFALPGYVSRNGWAAILDRSWDDGSGLPWKSLLHYPVGAFIVAPLSVGWRFLLPLLFWATHLGMDYVQTASGPLSTPIEASVMAAGFGGTLALLYRNWLALEPEGDLHGFARAMGTRLSGYGSAVKRRLGSNV